MEQQIKSMELKILDVILKGNNENFTQNSR